MEIFKKKMAKRNRKNIWRKRKREEIKASDKEEKRLAPVMDKMATEWQEHEQNLLKAKKQEEQDRKIKQQKDADEEKKWRAQQNTAIVLAKLEQLRRLRVRNIQGQGRQVLDNNIFAPFEDMPIQPVVKMDNYKSYKNFSSGHKSKKIRKNKEKETKQTDYARHPELYYYQAYKSLDNLVHIRRDWDRFITPNNIPGASRIPAHFLTPPETNNPKWKVYQIKTKV
mmetsp:Transcript_30299/g.33850  ORF Transcript_30299/g.33850 Transcript_30299/m.33850 type:complete len:225 (-) Transcript_30299:17-691(-)